MRKRVVHLYRTARDGFTDMGPALRTAFNQRTDDDNLPGVFGPRPALTLAALTVLAIGLGYGLAALIEASDARVLVPVHWPVVLVAVFLALPIRRYLFQTGNTAEADFPWLAASMIPAVALLTLIGLLTGLASGELQPIEDGPGWTVIGSVLIMIAEATSHAAAVTLAAAALCFSRKWFNALMELAVLVFLLRLVLWVFEYILLEIEIVQRILAALLDALLGIRLPSWLGDLSDEFSLAVLMLAINLAVIGATWTVCRDRFGELLATGDVNIVKAVRDAVDPPSEKALQKREAKLEKKARKQAEKAARKAAKNKS
ncbi:MAG: hypothetical protein AAF265_00635 [Pseudomonadota bacterium]